MTISAEQHARIRKLYFGEHWKVGTIASELGIHPDAIKRAVETPRFGNRIGAQRPSMLDPFKPFIVATLKDHPRLCGTRIYQMIQSRGYPGGIAQLHRYLKVVRPESSSEAFFALETLAGEQGQVDWAHCGKMRIGAALRTLLLFVMVLSFSRKIFARFFFDAKMENFQRGHVEAFEHFEGAPRDLLYDNLKSVVLERVGEHVRFHPQILELASHYCFAPKPCAVYRGNEKGKVERAIQYIRTSFLGAREMRDLDTLNAELAQWLEHTADARRHPTDPDQRTVQQCYEQQERARLVPLPAHPMTCEATLLKRSGKQPYLRFDGNDYSIPHTLVRKPLSLRATDRQVRVFDGLSLVASHARSYDRRQRIEEPEHLHGLAEHKRAARSLTGRDRILSVSPHAEGFYEQLALRGSALGSATSQLLRTLQMHGAETLHEALGEALDKGVISPSAVAHLCDQRRRAQGRPVPLPPETAWPRAARDLHVQSHDLASYDALGEHPKDDEPSSDEEPNR